MNTIFKILILLARPAAGKSEIIHYLRGLSDEERFSKFHIGKMHVIDDFPILWNWFEEDSLLKEMGKSQIYTDENGYFINNYLWDLLIKKINLVYEKFIRDTHDNDQYTVILEFSRGKEHGGYRNALPHLSKAILDKAAILYIDVSWEESLRKNRKRFNPEKPDSILQHSLPDEKLLRLYRETDWNEITASDSKEISIGKIKVPYANFNNEDDVTTKKNRYLEERLGVSLERLWQNYLNLKPSN